MPQYDILIIGAGLVGLATAWRLKVRKPELHIAVLEKEKAVAVHQSGHNSGVIHSGIYYKPGSQKAENCLRGYRMLLDFCDQYDVPCDLCGKLIVAKSKDEEPVLQEIFHRGLANGMDRIRLITGEEAREYEPHVQCTSAITVPQAGIIDFRLLAEKIAALLTQKGVVIHFGEKVRATHESDSEIVLETEANTFSSKHLVNCGGLYADKLALMASVDPDFRILPFRGEFYKVTGESEKLVRGLIYPVPDMRYPFLGIHLTKVIGGGLEAGPNAVLAWRREGYSFSDVHLGELAGTLNYAGFWSLAAKHWRKGIAEIYRSLSKSAFYRDVKTLVPEIREEDLSYARSGVRAQAVNPQGELIYDYVIRTTPRSFHICNAPSPAATSCLSIGEGVAEEVLQRLL